jgi:hypothetical protein
MGIQIVRYHDIPRMQCRAENFFNIFIKHFPIHSSIKNEALIFTVKFYRGKDGCGFPMAAWRCVMTPLSLV